MGKTGVLAKGGRAFKRLGALLKKPLLGQKIFHSTKSTAIGRNWRFFPKNLIFPSGRSQQKSKARGAEFWTSLFEASPRIPANPKVLFAICTSKEEQIEYKKKKVI